MGNEELNKKVMWYEVYRELAELLAEIKGKELYKRCFEEDEFLELHPWTQKFIDYEHEETLKTLDPMHVFASINSSRMRKELRLKRIHLYFKILGVNNSKEKYPNINFTGCPSPVTISLMAARNEKSQKRIWKVFKEIMNKSYKNKKIDYFDLTTNWYGIAIESFTIFLFWIDAKNFLPLDKNTVSLLKKYDKLEESPKTWETYRNLLIETDTDLYISLARTAWSANIDDLDKDIRLTVEKYLLQENFKGISSEFINFSIDTDFKLIGIHLLADYKGLSSGWFIFDKAFKVNDVEIKYYEEKDINIYDRRINITAIVGKNGTGKSTLVELLLETIHNSTEPNSTEPKIEYLFKQEHLYKVDSSSTISEYRLEDKDYRKNENYSNEKKSKEFFSNLLMNYSIHGLNSKDEKNKWIEDIDPKLITIEPERESGVIDINKEEVKVKEKLILNLLREDSSDIDGDKKTKDNFNFRELTESKKKAVKLVQKDGKFKSIEEFSKEIANDIMNKEEMNHKKYTIKDYIPDGLFIDIEIEGKIFFNELSSGEKQKIYSINTIVNYLVKSQEEDQYKPVNIILDEIELYFHPELQRTYIRDLVTAIDLANIDLLINITFITHSPFILSDIPDNKILFLKKNKKGLTVHTNKDVNTFGANIHSLLSDSFFMENGLIGEFAKNKIQEVIDFLNEKESPIKDATSAKRIIDIIAEPFLQMQLRKIYNQKFSDKVQIDKQIGELKRELKRLEDAKLKK